MIMPLERLTAKKVRIADITNGEWVKKEGMEPSFILTNYKERISRARVLGTVVAKFMREDGNFGSITIDDGSDTIRAKTFKTVKPVEGIEIGNVIDIVGKIREYNGEVYVMPEVLLRVENPNLELLRALEIHKKLRDFESGARGEPVDVKEDVRKEILTLMGEKSISYNDILKKVDASEKDIEYVINELLSEGICYEPKPGMLKKI